MWHFGVQMVPKLICSSKNQWSMMSVKCFKSIISTTQSLSMTCNAKSKPKIHHKVKSKHYKTETVCKHKYSYLIRQQICLKKKLELIRYKWRTTSQLHQTKEHFHFDEWSRNQPTLFSHIHKLTNKSMIWMVVAPQWTKTVINGHRNECEFSHEYLDKSKRFVHI